MGRRVVVLLSLCLCLAAQQSHDVRFIHPKSRIKLAGINGTDVPIQLWVEPHKDNRWLDFDIYLDTLRVNGSFGRPLDGEFEARVQPDRKLHSVRLHPGTYQFIARVCTSTKDEGPRTVCDRQRASASMEFKVCGGEEGC